MEVVIIGALAGLGYYVNPKRELDIHKSIPNRKKIEPQYQQDTYNSTYYNNTTSFENTQLNKNYTKAKDAVNTNKIPNYFNDRIFNDQTTTVQYLQRPVADRRSTSIQSLHTPDQDTPTTSTEPFFSKIAGQSIENFNHNNMVPFFGGSIRQSIDANANSAILENFNGTNNFKQEKKAIEPLFKPTKDVSFVNGTPNSTALYQDRYVPSMYRTNEVPTEPIHVGPGLNQGYSSNPTGGFQQFDAQEYALPRTVDQLRTLNNPKIAYESRVSGAPKAIVTNRGLQGQVEKHLPDKYYEQTKDMYLKTTGANLKPQLHGLYEDKETSRQNSVSYEGVAGPASTYTTSLRPSIRDSRNLNYTTDGMRNASLQVFGESDKFDHGAASFTAKYTERQTTEDKSIINNITTAVKSIIAPLLDIFRTTRKENIIGHPNKVGYMGVQAPSKIRVHDTNDVARTTLKETKIHDNRTGSVGVAPGTKKSVVYDPNDIARTTLKETKIHDNRTGSVGVAPGTKKQVVYDPNDVARTTMKETKIHDNRTGSVGVAPGTKKQVVYDPNDIARTTMKETKIHDNRIGAVGVAPGTKKQVVYDPNDIARTTMKETQIHDNRTGAVGVAPGTKKQAVYDPNDIARTTMKETKIHDNRTGAVGVATGTKKQVVYDPNDIARTTMKETKIHDNRTGAMGVAPGTHKQVVYDPNDIARTTMKETKIHDNRTGSMGVAQGTNKQAVYDPNDVARTTLKETKIHDTRTGYFGTNAMAKKQTVYDPIEGKARTTLKETKIHDTRTGSVGIAGSIKKQTVHDPNDITRTTVKETNIHHERTGNVGNTSLQNGDGYTAAEYDAPNTNRQFTSDTEYTGIADGQTGRGAGDGYQTAEFDAQNTNRQFTSDNEYTGGAKDYLVRPMDDNMYEKARLNETRTGVSEGRYPTANNVKIATGGEDINMEVKKLEGDRVNQYSPTVHRLYTQTPSLGKCTITTDKNQLQNESLAARIDPNMLTAFTENPYTHPLNSSY